jgi:hypothetical protein
MIIDDVVARGKLSEEFRSTKSYDEHESANPPCDF